MSDDKTPRDRPDSYWTPRPDPTLLTTEQSNRLRDEMRREIEMLREIVFTRFTAMDHAAELLATHVKDCPSKEELSKYLAIRTVEIDNSFKGIAELFTEKLLGANERLVGLRNEFIEKFTSIQNQFKERDVRTDQASIASSTAVNAALQAQKEAAGAQNESNAAAITKSEAATTKQIDGIQLNITSNIAALNDKISEIRGRLDRGEGANRGAIDTRTERSQNVGMIVGLVTVAALGTSMLVGAVSFIIAHSNPTPVGPQFGYNPPTIVSPAVVPVQPK